MSKKNSSRQNLVGAWQLISFDMRTTNGHLIQPLGAEPKGLLTYSESGYFSAQAMGAERSTITSGMQMTATPEEMSENYKSVISYFGTYEIDQKQGCVLHHVKGSLFPNREDKTQVRYFSFSDNQMQLKTQPINWGNFSKAVGELNWQKTT